MAEQNYRKDPEDFKLEALALLKQGQKSAGQIERELGITPGLLVKWRACYQAVEKGSGEVHLEPSDLEAAKAEIRRLQRELAEVEEEREILKKRCLLLICSTRIFPRLPRIANGLVTHLHRHTSAGVTYIETEEGWLYLAAILDLFSRRVVGWAMDEHMEASLAQNAWNMAIFQRNPSAELLHHSDQGSQYTSDLYQQSLAAHHCRVSMSRVGNCFDNVAMESFFSTLKTECANQPFATRAQARTTIFEYIEGWYNRQRLHSALDYLSPAEFERKPRHSSCP